MTAAEDILEWEARMSAEVREITLGSGHHGVYLYEGEADLAHTVGRYLTEAARAGGAAVVIATDEHRRRFEANLLAAGVDVDALRGVGRLVMLDAETTLDAIRPAGLLDPEAFREVIGTVLGRAAASGTTVRAYGEMVSLLWDRGDVSGAIELEKLWNELQAELEFSLLCGYRSQSVSGPEHVDAVGEVCRLHSTVVSAPPHSDQVSGGFSAAAEAPGEARQFVADALRRWGHDGRLIDDAKLIVSELATNAVVHAHSPFSIALRTEGSIVRMSVRDASPGTPRLRERADQTDRGRGLALVAAVAQRWGVEPTQAGKIVWAELPESGG